MKEYKVGDKLVISFPYERLGIGTVTRITKSMIVVICDDHEYKFNRQTGMLRGETDSWHFTTISNMTVEDGRAEIKRLNSLHAKKRIANKILNKNVNDLLQLSKEKLEQILVIIENKQE